LKSPARRQTTAADLLISFHSQITVDEAQDPLLPPPVKHLWSRGADFSRFLFFPDEPADLRTGH